MIQKRITGFLMGLLLCICTACGADELQETEIDSEAAETVKGPETETQVHNIESEEPEMLSQSKILIAYFTWAENTDIGAALPDDCTVLAEFGAYRPEVAGSQDELLVWLRGLDITY